MVLEMKIPHGDDLASLRPLIPVFVSYVLSFTFIGIYWNNHHHLLHAIHKVNGATLWANMHLLFWLSLIPFVTGWMGENHFHTVPVALYGVVLLMAGGAYFNLVRVLMKHHGKDSELAKAIGSDLKGKISLASYAAAIPLAWVYESLSMSIYFAVAVMWLVPDRRIESRLKG
jgi:uncharacterized membrane protein